MNYRSRGWRWPFRNGDSIEVWSGTEKVAEIPQDILHELIVLRLRETRALAELRTALLTPPSLPPTKLEVPMKPHPRLRRPLTKRLRGLPVLLALALAACAAYVPSALTKSADESIQKMVNPAYRDSEQVRFEALMRDANICTPTGRSAAERLKQSGQVYTYDAAMYAFLLGMKGCLEMMGWVEAPR